MKMIDICDNYSGAGCLKAYYQENNKSDFQIIAMCLNLSIGDIKNDHLSFIKKLYGDTRHNYNESINRLLNSIDKNSIIRVWSSNRNADDYLLLLYICNLLKNKCDNIYVVYSTDYNENAVSINGMDYREINKLLKNEKQLTTHEINTLSNEWNKLIGINSELRVLENGRIVNKQYSDYDDIILAKLKELKQCRISDLVSELIANFVINDSDSSVYLYLIDRLIYDNKIKIIEKGERHFMDIIEAQD